jgi:hypothetical protein
VVGVIFLDLFYLYLQLISATSASGFPQATKTDIARTDTNIRYLTTLLDAQDIVPHELIEILRDAQRNNVFLTTQAVLFGNTYAAKLKDYYAVLG